MTVYNLIHILATGYKLLQSRKYQHLVKQAHERAIRLVEAVDAPHLYRAVTPDHPPHYPHQL